MHEKFPFIVYIKLDFTRCWRVHIQFFKSLFRQSYGLDMAMRGEYGEYFVHFGLVCNAYRTIYGGIYYLVIAILSITILFKQLGSFCSLNRNLHGGLYCLPLTNTCILTSW